MSLALVDADRQNYWFSTGDMSDIQTHSEKGYSIYDVRKPIELRILGLEAFPIEVIDIIVFVQNINALMVEFPLLTIIFLR